MTKKNTDDRTYSYYAYDHAGGSCGSREQSQACLSYAEMEQSVRSNHLGSAAYLTNDAGQVTQTLSYLPYGEEFVKQLGGSYDERFTFTGKERDAETGYYYFGARFDNVDLGFMSVDPMADKYPSMSPYAYCAWNPVKLVDPEGRAPWEPEITEKGEVSYVAEKGDTKETFAKQYGLTSHKANAIFDKAGVSEVNPGTTIIGSVVNDVTHNSILKVDWRHATDEQKAYQAMFGILNANLNKEVANMEKYFSNLPLNGTPAQLSLKNIDIPLYNGERMELQAFNSSFCAEQPKVGFLQPPINHTNKVSQTFLQCPFSGGVGIKRITVSYSPSKRDEFLQSYY